MKNFIGWLIEKISSSGDWFIYDSMYRVIVIESMPNDWRVFKIGKRIFTTDRCFEAIKKCIATGKIVTWNEEV